MSAVFPRARLREAIDACLTRDRPRLRKRLRELDGIKVPEQQTARLAALEHAGHSSRASGQPSRRELPG